jgi:hypothetical protein
VDQPSPVQRLSTRQTDCHSRMDGRYRKPGRSTRHQARIGKSLWIRSDCPSGKRRNLGAAIIFKKRHVYRSGGDLDAAGRDVAQ